ncbi:MAG: AAA family ATPase [Crocinitomicaceae bacterium]|jgi:DNA repair protein RecN (Recombination protein N)|tara:strand:+ start:12794 stop:14434 length:1641 start_codon:yes stop_codon:yes gene_type:complete
MIQRLRISNFALIENLELDLKKGFSVLTGETGSGKSILLSAFSLLLGERSSSNLVGAYSRKAIVEAQLDASPEDKVFFKAHNLDYDEPLLLRREIVKDGKSRAFINDSPVPLSTLKAFSIEKLMVHSQYNTFELKSKKKQLELYDLLSGNEKRALAFSLLFENYNAHGQDLEDLKITYVNENKDRDYNDFLKQEIEDLKFDEVDYSVLESELFKLENSDAIRAILSELNAFTEEGAIYSKVKQYVFGLEKLGTKDKGLLELIERLHAIGDDLSMVSSESSYYIDSMGDDPSRKSFIIKQWDAYNRLLLKHGFKTQLELQGLLDDLSKRNENIEGLKQRIADMEIAHKVLESKIDKAANQLHSKRMNSSSLIANSLKEELFQLKLPETKLDFKIERGALQSTGITNLSMVFSANKGYDMIDIENAASGGELSRLMLALLKRISEEKKMPTILFDEIDSGVSGDVADKIGVLLHKMGNQSQLLVISHLPQVASKASAHYIVEKKEEKERTRTYVRLLSEDERIYEVARLMSGEDVTKAALETAKTLMN